MGDASREPVAVFGAYAVDGACAGQDRREPVQDDQGRARKRARLGVRRDDVAQVLVRGDGLGLRFGY